MELGNQIGQHAAGDLVEQGVGVHIEDLGVEVAPLFQLFSHAAEVFGGSGHPVQVQSGIPDGAPEGDHQGLGGGL